MDEETGIRVIDGLSDEEIVKILPGTGVRTVELTDGQYRRKLMMDTILCGIVRNGEGAVAVAVQRANALRQMHVNIEEVEEWEAVNLLNWQARRNKAEIMHGDLLEAELRTRALMGLGGKKDNDALIRSLEAVRPEKYGRGAVAKDAQKERWLAEMRNAGVERRDWREQVEEVEAKAFETGEYDREGAI